MSLKAVHSGEKLPVFRVFVYLLIYFFNDCMGDNIFGSVCPSVCQFDQFAGLHSNVSVFVSNQGVFAVRKNFASTVDFFFLI